MPTASRIAEARAALTGADSALRVLPRADGAPAVAFLRSIDYAGGDLIVPLAEGPNLVGRGTRDRPPFGAWPQPYAVEQAQWQIDCDRRRARLRDASSTNGSGLVPRLIVPGVELGRGTTGFRELLAQPGVLEPAHPTVRCHSHFMPLREGDVLRSFYASFVFGWIELGVDPIAAAPATPLRSNRDLYLFVTRLDERYRVVSRSLETYLCALWPAMTARREEPSLPLSWVGDQLERALVADPEPFDPRWGDAQPASPLRGYAGWEALIRAQIVDLHELAATGALADPQRELGIDSPRGARWYNFEPLSYLECAVEGAFGGWAPEDATGRIFVPGQVAALDEGGRIVSVDPADLDQPHLDLQMIDWDALTELLQCGQWYE